MCIRDRSSRDIKSGILKNTAYQITDGSMSPSEACSKYDTNLDPITNKNNIVNIDVVDLKTSKLKLFERILFLNMPWELWCITINILSVNTINRRA